MSSSMSDRILRREARFLPTNWGPRQYVEELSDGFRHDDPMIGVKWPEPVTVLSAKDAAWPLLGDRYLW